MRKYSLFLLFFFFICHSCNNEPRPDIESAIQKAQLQLENTLQEIHYCDTLYPSETDQGTLNWNKKAFKISPRWWTSGFFPGCYWMMYQITKQEKWKQYAEKWTEGLENQKGRTDLADMSGIISFSYGNGYKCTLNPDYIRVIDSAATTFCKYFYPAANAIKCWESGWSKTNHAVVTDFLSFTELMFIAHQLTGNKNYLEVVTSHIKKTIECNIREDGSTWQFTDLNDNGSVIGHINTLAYQGMKGGTRWTRAQAWAINGLTLAYRYTKDDLYLKKAILTADYFIANLPGDFIPPSDFDGHADSLNGRDASAAAIACSGLIELAKYTGNKTYHETAKAILSSLCSPSYQGAGAGYSSILKRSKVRYSEPEIGLIYGDYFFLEAIAKLKGVYPYH